MIVSVEIALALIAFSGHAAMVLGCYNRLHATALPHWLVESLTALVALAGVGVPIAYAWWYLAVGRAALGGGWQAWLTFTAAYLVICWIAAFVAWPRWAWRRIAGGRVHLLVAQATEVVDLAAEPAAALLHGPLATLLYRVPGNEIFRLHVETKQVVVERLPAALDGLKLAQLSDIHFTGQIGPEFFHRVVEETNARTPDVIAVTGDLVDEPRCIEWIDAILGRLRAPLGVYFVLGNHDVRRGHARAIREACIDAGLTYLGGRWMEVRWRNEPVTLAGNELPWIAPAPAMEHAPPRHGDGRPLRLLVAHTPDQLAWAKARDFDLMLAGHTHGGQIRLPLLGPLISPSRYGVKYSAGLYFEPPTLLHVSRGISGDEPIRLGCPPELALLVLRSPKAA